MCNFFEFIDHNLLLQIAIAKVKIIMLQEILKLIQIK